MPDNTLHSVRFPDVVVIPQVVVTSSFQRIIDFTLGIVGADWQDVRDMATAIVGDSRDATNPAQYLIMPGVHGLGEQSIDASHPLSIRWVGSTAPFSISIAKGNHDTGTIKLLETTSDRHATLAMSGMVADSYSLEIKGANGVFLRLPIRLVAASDVPALKGATTENSSSQEYRLEEAIFLLRGAPPAWRIEAISRLLTLASQDHDFFAQAIVGLENVTKK